jgi:hypothetical protein
MSAQAFDRDIYATIARIDTVLATNVLSQPHPLRQSAFIEIVIRLDELTGKANSIGRRISFTDDVRLFPGVKDITDAIREYRNAVCHVYANAHFITPKGHPKQRGERLKKGEGYGQVSFCVINGKGTLIKTPLYAIESEYEDDVCFIFGAHRLYLRRHIFRVFREAMAILAPNFPNPI